MKFEILQTNYVIILLSTTIILTRVEISNNFRYMQRPGGSADGTDLIQKGLEGVKQAKFVPKNQVDLKYEQDNNSGFNLPWTSSSLNMFSKKPNKPDDTKTDTLTKSTTIRPKPKNQTVEEPKKKLFGLF